MKASLVKDTIKWLLAERQQNPDHAPKMALMLTSAPGVGKSSIVYQAAEESENTGLIEFRPANHGIEDLVGLPNFIKQEDGTMRSTFATPDWLPREDRDGKYGILFIDEMAQAPLSMQNALTQLILDRRMHDYQLPNGWIIVCASNRSKDRAGTTKTPSQLNNRLRFIGLDFSLEEWTNWAHDANLEQVLIAFAKFKGGQLFEQFDPAQQINCTPRSFADCSPIINAPEALRSDLLRGTIGEGVHSELLAFVQVWKDLPTIEQIMEDPENIHIDLTRADILCAVQNSLAMNVSTDTADKIDLFIKRLPPDYQTSYYRDALRLCSELEDTEAFDRFLEQNAGMLM